MELKQCKRCKSPIEYRFEKVEDWKTKAIEERWVTYHPNDERCDNPYNRGMKHVCINCKSCNAVILHIGGYFPDKTGYWTTAKSSQELPHRCRQYTEQHVKGSAQVSEEQMRTPKRDAAPLSPDEVLERSYNEFVD